VLITFIRTWILRRLRPWAKPATRTPVIGALTDLTRSRSALIAENMLLRQQLIVLERRIKRPKLTWWDRALLVFLASRIAHWKDALLIVQPETLLRWHRDLFRMVWRHKSKPSARLVGVPYPNRPSPSSSKWSWRTSPGAPSASAASCLSSV
jgi:hypothetical protein